MSDNILHGSGFAGWRDPPFGYSSPPDSPLPASLLKPQDTTHRDGVPRKWPRPSTTARQSRIPLLLVSLFAVSAMIFLVYLCSLLMRKRITRPSFARRLAVSWGREKCEESGSSSSESSASASSEQQQGLQDAGVQLFAGLTPVDELLADTEYASVVDVTAGAAVQAFLRATAERVTKDGMSADLKRGGQDPFNEGDWAKKLILEMPLQEGPLQPAPPLDPDLDAFIDAVLLGSEDPLAESTWLPEYEPQNSEPLDLSVGSRPSTSRGAAGLAQAWGTMYDQLSVSSHGPDDLRENQKERSRKTQQPTAGPSAPQNIPRGSAADVSGPLPFTEASFACAKVQPVVAAAPQVVAVAAAQQVVAAPEELQVVDAAEAPQVVAATKGPQRVADADPQPAAVAASQSVAAATPHPVAAIGPQPVAAAAPQHVNAAVTPQSVAPTAPPTPGSHQQRKRELSSYLEAASSLAPAKRLIILKQPAAIILPSFSSGAPASASRLLLPAVTTLRQQRAPSQQPATASVPPSDGDFLLYFGWLTHVFPGVPPELLKSHPYYRVPPIQETSVNKKTVNSRSFDMELALTLSTTQRFAVNALNKCRKILKKDALAPSDLNELLSNAEALCAFAIRNMPVAYKRCQAKCAIEIMGMIFLVLDTLYCAAEVLGERALKHSWWPLVLLHIREARFVPHKLSTQRQKYNNVDVARTLHAALEYYRRSQRAPMLMVLGLKKALLCTPDSVTKFTAAQWGPWREDDEEWIRSIQTHLSGSEQRTPSPTP